jgi:hypothetical protein
VVVVVAVLLLRFKRSLGLVRIAWSCFNVTAVGVGCVMEEMWCGVCVYRSEKRRKGRQANTHNDRILRCRDKGL